jgi:hypothetical protein
MHTGVWMFQYARKHMISSRHPGASRDSLPAMVMLESRLAPDDGHNNIEANLQFLPRDLQR